MRLWLLIPMMALALMGQTCAQTDEQVRSVLRTTCPAVETAYTNWSVVAATGAIDQGIVNKVDFYKGQMDGFCADPETATTASVLATAAATYLAIKNGLNQAKARGVAVAYQGEISQLEGLMEKVRRGHLTNHNKE